MGSIDQPAVSQALVENLTYGSAWYFRGYVMDGENVIYSDNIIKVIMPYLPEATILAPATVTARTALLQATVNAKNNTAAIVFEYDTAAAFAHAINATPAVLTGDSNVAVHALLGNL